MPHPGLSERFPQAYISMGETAENLATRYQITRLEQEAFAVESQRRAAAAEASGRFEREIVPISVEGSTIARDGCIRPGTTAEVLAALPPAFDSQGSVTAGTSSPVTDGAAALLVSSEDYARSRGLKALARIKAVAVSGCPPEIMGIGPVPASLKALERAGLGIDDIAVAEVNEAFASQSLAVLRELRLDPAKVNLDGGAIALGHPLGASGARITGKAANFISEGRGRFALSTQCIGGGQGIATVLEAV
jgi:acetyl-CoA acyltransferase